jgi:hypothetical protein
VIYLDRNRREVAFGMSKVYRPSCQISRFRAGCKLLPWPVPSCTYSRLPFSREMRFFLPLVRLRLLDSGTTGLIVPDLNLKRCVDTVDYLYIDAILHVPTLDHLCVYIKLIIIPSYTLWAQQCNHASGIDFNTDSQRRPRRGRRPHQSTVQITHQRLEISESNGLPCSSRE